jgi:hypothetical protein
MDIQYKTAIKTGSFKLKLLALTAMALQAIYQAAGEARSAIERRAPMCSCEHPTTTVLNCGMCYDALMAKYHPTLDEDAA